MKNNNIIIGIGNKQVESIATELLNKLESNNIYAEIAYQKGPRNIHNNLLAKLGKKDINYIVAYKNELPDNLPEDINIIAVCERHDPSWSMVMTPGKYEKNQPLAIKKNTKVGVLLQLVSQQVAALRPDIKIEQLDNNMDETLKKLEDNRIDGAILPSLWLNTEIENKFNIEKFSPRFLIPAPEYAFVVILGRKDDTSNNVFINEINHLKTTQRYTLESELKELSMAENYLLGAYSEHSVDDEENEILSVWTCCSKQENQLPAFLYEENVEVEKSAESILYKYKNVNPCSVYISKNIYNKGLLKNSLEANGFKIEGIGLNEQEMIPIKQLPETEWVFFSNKLSVDFFFKQTQLKHQQRIGVISKSVADAVRKYNVRAEFIGQSEDTKITGRQFAAKVGKASVLFPKAKELMGSIQKQFTVRDKLFELNVYQTIENTVKLKDYDVLIFTNPAAVRTFFKSNQIQSTQKAIALGGATKAELQKYGVKRAVLCNGYDDMAILQCIYHLSTP
ncbi:MAG: uroporphyrinogen-III synthase [Bacteroidia bacterium]|nr:uroporphyrinogen-III synthase [Bacteroidia bacterium]MCZ2247233.1 uroporphyrinogen-III synthase [Bacteroidia bacterium]